MNVPTLASHIKDIDHLAELSDKQMRTHLGNFLEIMDGQAAVGMKQDFDSIDYVIVPRALLNRLVAIIQDDSL